MKPQVPTIIAEKDVYKRYRITKKLLDEAIKRGEIRAKRSVAGGNFFDLADVEAQVAKLEGEA